MVSYSCTDFKKNIVSWFSTDYRATAGEVGKPEFDKEDAGKPKIPVKLTKVAGGFAQITSFSFFPNDPNTLVVLEKEGKLKTFDVKTNTSRTVATISVKSASEQGLLGIAFHPAFDANRKFYLNYIPAGGSKDLSRIEEWLWEAKGPRASRILFEVDQPYPNHNGGHLAFGPDGRLYAGFGDGGWAGDPDGHSQNPKSFLGKMLRFNVDEKDPKPEVWLSGLRNPWRYSFGPAGELIVADVGQNAWEEVTIAGKGDNLGWNILEGKECFSSPSCNTAGLKSPALVYGRKEGKSITGGYVNLDKNQRRLANKYIFGDFTSGRIWAVDLVDLHKPTKSDTRFALGKWPLMISTFGQDAQGRVYVANFMPGDIYRIDED
jgi:glucose/arabinose dehydrogenase